MRHAWWDADDIPGADLAAYSTYDRAIPFLVWADGFSVNELAANYQSCRPGLHKEDINLRFVPLHRTICGTVHEKERIVWIVGQLPDSKLVRVGWSFGYHLGHLRAHRLGRP